LDKTVAVSSAFLHRLPSTVVKQLVNDATFQFAGSALFLSYVDGAVQKFSVPRSATMSLIVSFRPFFWKYGLPLLA
jgi:hypothetical protein